MAADVRRFAVVYGLLLLLLATTIACGILLPAGPVKPFISFGIAFAKAALIYWFFMRLRAEAGLVRLFALAALLWVFILFFLGFPVD
jgi:cytochrome c oxidase subunit IV